jgi:alpha-L-rhamnosidase
MSETSLDTRQGYVNRAIRGVGGPSGRAGVTGGSAVGYLLPVLSAHGFSDVAYRVLSQETLPSWRYMLDHGATTIWERGTGGRPTGAGFRSPVLRPHPCGPEGPLRWARGSYRSVRGVVGAGWEVSGDRFTYRVELPPGMTATVRLPGPDGVPEAVYEAGSGTHEFSGPGGA